MKDFEIIKLNNNEEGVGKTFCPQSYKTLGLIQTEIIWFIKRYIFGGNFLPACLLRAFF